MNKVNANFEATTGEYDGITYDQFLGKARLVSIGSGKFLPKSNGNEFALVDVEFVVGDETIATSASASPKVYETLTAGDTVAISLRKGEDGKNYASIIGVSGAGMLSDDLFDKVVASATVTESAPTIEA